MTRSFLVVAALLFAACPPPPPEGDDGGPPADAGDDDGGPDALRALASGDDYALLAGDDDTVKYLAPVDGEQPVAPIVECTFQNTARYPYHLQFVQTLDGGDELTFDDYIALVLKRETRAWWGGEVLWRAVAAHPLTDEPGVLAFTLYTEDSPGNRLVIDDVRAAHAVLSPCAPGFAGMLAFAPSSTEQRETALVIADELANEGIAVLLPGG